MSGRNIRISLTLIGSLIIGIGTLLGDGIVVGEGQNDRNLELGIWTPETKIEQTFVASRNNLCRIDVAFDSYHPWKTPYLDYRLYEIETSENPQDLTYESITKNRKEVRHKRINGWWISGHMFNSFSFTPISDSQNKRYLLSIQAPVVKGEGSILLASGRDRYDYGNLFLNGKRRKEDLGFRFLYKQPRVQLVQQIVTRLALHKPFPFSKPVSYYVLFGVYILLLLMFFFFVQERQ